MSSLHRILIWFRTTFLLSWTCEFHQTMVGLSIKLSSTGSYRQSTREPLKVVWSNVTSFSETDSSCNVEQSLDPMPKNAALAETFVDFEFGAWKSCLTGGSGNQLSHDCHKRVFSRVWKQIHAMCNTYAHGLIKVLFVHVWPAVVIWQWASTIYQWFTMKTAEMKKSGKQCIAWGMQ